MTPKQILEHAREQIEISGEDAPCGLFLPGKWGKTSMRRLCPGGPTGEIVNDNFDGRGIYVLFKAREVEAWALRVLRVIG